MWVIMKSFEVSILSLIFMIGHRNSHNMCALNERSLEKRIKTATDWTGGLIPGDIGMSVWCVHMFADRLVDTPPYVRQLRRPADTAL